MSDAIPAGSPGVGNKGAVTVIELERHERAVARRSAEARATVPSIEYGAVVGMDAALAREAQLGCGTTPLLVVAVARALTRVRRVNGAYRDGRFELYSRVNVGVTIAEEGLYVIPTVFDADRKSPDEIAAELAGLSARARSGSLSAAELSGATFTLSAAAHSAGTLTPLIVPPQAASLAAGPVREVPVVRDGAVVPGHTMLLTLACDHRIVYGAHAASFLEEIKAQLEEAMP